MTNVQNKSIWGILLQLQLIQPSEAFMEALIQDSNYENEWLYTATETQNTLEIRYCLERALYINPNNIHTAHRLSKLNQQMNTVREDKSVEQRSFFNRITNYLYQAG